KFRRVTLSTFDLVMRWIQFEDDFSVLGLGHPFVCFSPGLIGEVVAGFALFNPFCSMRALMAIDAPLSFCRTKAHDKVRRAIGLGSFGLSMAFAAGNDGVLAAQREKFIVIEIGRRLPVHLIMALGTVGNFSTLVRVRMAGGTGVLAKT